MTQSTNAGNNADASRGSTEPLPARRIGITARGERILDVAGLSLIGLFAVAWGWSVAYAREATRRGESAPMATRGVTAALSRSSASGVAYLTDATLEAVVRHARGVSGKLRVQTALPGGTIITDSLPGGHLVYTSPGEVRVREARPTTPGIRAVAVAIGNALKPVTNLNLITLTPFSAKERGRIGLYYIGNWPSERGARGPGKAPPGRYASPMGFIQVTWENQDIRVSEHFKLEDFLTKDQPNVWPKYLVLEMRLVDKLELVLSDLAARGVRVDGVTVMSGFRTPQYNVAGGNTGGRAGLSRHMYGDAADVYIDNDRNGSMDDLDGNGRIDTGDARFMLESVERVEREHPELIGGTGVYAACCGHGPFIHIDTRGYRARWTGSGGG